MRRVTATELAVRSACSVLRQNLLRSVLTLAVCGFGTAGVIVAGALGRANAAELQARLRALGGRLLIVSPNKVPPYPGRVRQLPHFISLAAEDATAIAEQVSGVESAVPVVARDTTVRLDRSAARVRLLGTTPEYLSIRGFEIAGGRFLLPEDARRRAIVLGHAVSHELRPGGTGRGETVALGGQPYEVVGVLAPQGVNFAGEDEDYQAFIPLETYQVRVANRPWLSYLYLQLEPAARSSAVVARVQMTLRDRHGRFRDQVDDVVVSDLADLAAQQSGLHATAAWAVGITSGLLLGMGIVGITTLMFLVVQQRRPEIGLRRALGATGGDIALQFFLEGVALAALGVVAGLLAGIAIVGLWSFSAPASMRLETAWLCWAAGISVGMSALACLLPAWKAARMEPAAALRA
jgi:putative ABC transport system permease protein